MNTPCRGDRVSAPVLVSRIPTWPLHIRAMRSALAALIACGLLLPGVLAAAADDGGAVVGEVFVDSDGDGVRSPGEAGVAGVMVQLTSADANRVAVTDESGAYRFDGVDAGSYLVGVLVPNGYQALWFDTVEQQVEPGLEAVAPSFAFSSGDQPAEEVAPAEEQPTAESTPHEQPADQTQATPSADDQSAEPEAQASSEPELATTPTEETAAAPTADAAALDPAPTSAPPGVIARPTDAAPPTPQELATPVVDAPAPLAVSTVVATAPALVATPQAEVAAPEIELGSAPISPPEAEVPEAYQPVQFNPARFAPRDNGPQPLQTYSDESTVWLGVPFRSQLDSSAFALVNCGPASLAMVLAAYGLDVPPSAIRDYVNYLRDNYNTQEGTSLDSLAWIAWTVGLTPLDLYTQNGYLAWDVDMVREHVLRGQPVITLVKYRSLPGHSSSLSDFDHYIVIAGLYNGDFIYNDAAYGSDVGYGMLISPENLEAGWAASSMPRHAMAIGSRLGELRFEAPLPVAVEPAPPPVDTAPAEAAAPPPPPQAESAATTAYISPFSPRAATTARVANGDPAAVPFNVLQRFQNGRHPAAVPAVPALDVPPPAPVTTLQIGASTRVTDSVPSYIVNVDQPRALLVGPLVLALTVAVALARAAASEARLGMSALVRWPARSRRWMTWVLFDPRLSARPTTVPTTDVPESDNPVPACAAAVVYRPVFSHASAVGSRRLVARHLQLRSASGQL